MDAARPVQGRHRSKSSFSFKSNKSDKSDPTRPRPELSDLTESPQERQKSKFALQTSRDPNKAIREAQPADRQTEANTLPDLRSAQYKDWKGDPITDPDTSNPTRPRLERPLDTIRSFEAAIEGEWKRKSHIPRSESEDYTQYSSRRASYVGGNETPYGNRHSTPVGGMRAGRNSHRYSDHYAPRPGNPRYQTSPMASQGNGWASHPAHGYSQSYDAFETGGSYATSGSEPWANSTDPSSENSSIERAYNMNGHKPDNGDGYVGQYRRESPRHDPIQEEHGFDGYGYTQGQWNGPSSLPPAPPVHSGQHGPPRPVGHSMAPSALPNRRQERSVIPLNSGFDAETSTVQYGASQPQPMPQPRSPGRVLRKESSNGEGKRKSWLRRRFSKG